MIICKICNPTLVGDGYCGEHSTSGTAYKLENKMTQNNFEIQKQKGMDLEKEKQERLNCPFCNPHTSYAASPEFFDQWRVKHDYHPKSSPI